MINNNNNNIVLENIRKCGLLENSTLSYFH